MPIQDIPLSQLELSPLNVRKTRSKEAIERMAASIEAHGLLQNLRVHPNGKDKFGVVVGGSRLAAMQLLLKQSKIAADYPVPCDVRLDGRTRPKSASPKTRCASRCTPPTSSTRSRSWPTTGRGPEEIAARFGTSAKIVMQRLKLAVVSPKLIVALPQGRDDARLPDGVHGLATSTSSRKRCGRNCRIGRGSGRDPIRRRS